MGGWGDLLGRALLNRTNDLFVVNLRKDFLAQLEIGLPRVELTISTIVKALSNQSICPDGIHLLPMGRSCLRHRIVSLSTPQCTLAGSHLILQQSPFDVCRNLGIKLR